jgi:hypothetical protein
LPEGRRGGKVNHKRWAYLKLAGAIGLAVVAIHGKSGRRWGELHTAAVLISALAMVGPMLTDG